MIPKSSSTKHRTVIFFLLFSKNGRLKMAYKTQVHNFHPPFPYPKYINTLQKLNPTSTTICWPAKKSFRLQERQLMWETDQKKKRVKRNQLCSNFLLDYRQTHQAKSRGRKIKRSVLVNSVTSTIRLLALNHNGSFRLKGGTLAHSLRVIYAETVLRRSKKSSGWSTCGWDWLGWTRIVDLHLTDAVV